MLLLIASSHQMSVHQDLPACDKGQRFFHFADLDWHRASTDKTLKQPFAHLLPREPKSRGCGWLGLLLHCSSEAAVAFKGACSRVAALAYVQLLCAKYWQAFLISPARHISRGK